MSTTTEEEEVGDVIYGTHLVRCHYRSQLNRDGEIVLCEGESLVAGPGQILATSRREVMDGGWERKVAVEVDTRAYDQTRATSRFEVMRVEDLIALTDGKTWYGGGPRIVVRRLDGGNEKIVYTRRCNYESSVREPAILCQAGRS